MAVNQSPMYQKAEERYRCASASADKLAALEEMWRLVPKHKASEKLQAQIKQRMKNVREEMQRGAQKAAGHAIHDPYAVRPQGAGQVLLLGEPNTGKSALVGALTNARVEIAEFPHSTHAAVPGMARHEDVPIQLVDMPPVTPPHIEPAMLAAYRSADVILLVVDLSALDLLDQLDRPLRMLADHRFVLSSQARLDFGDLESEADDAEERLPKRAIIAANKCDTPGAADNLEGLKELSGTNLTMAPVSATTGSGLPALMAELFGVLNVIRVYAKKPGKPADTDAPFVLPVGGTVYDMAELVHRGLADQLKTARVWGGSVHAGQQVHATHVLGDRDVVELHL